MQFESFPFCCQAEIFCNFGGGHARQDGCSSEELILKEFFSFWDDANKYEELPAVIFAAPTSTQQPAIKALEALGFYTSNGAPTHTYGEDHMIYPMFLITAEVNTDHWEDLRKKAESYKGKPNPFKKNEATDLDW